MFNEFMVFALGMLLITLTNVVKDRKVKQITALIVVISFGLLVSTPD